MILIDFSYLIISILPPAHRTVEVVAAVNAKFAPLITIRDWFYTFFDQIEYELTWNGQVCMLEHLLNLEFDPINIGIYITDAENLDNQYVFNALESNEPTIVFNNSEAQEPLYLFNNSEVAQYHFIVNVPSSVTFNEDQLKYFVNKYRLAGKRWKIEIV